jgi:hypothetical protein
MSADPHWSRAIQPNAWSGEKPHAKDKLFLAYEDSQCLKCRKVFSYRSNPTSFLLDRSLRVQQMWEDLDYHSVFSDRYKCPTLQESLMSVRGKGKVFTTAISSRVIQQVTLERSPVSIVTFFWNNKIHTVGGEERGRRKEKKKKNLCVQMTWGSLWMAFLPLTHKEPTLEKSTQKAVNMGMPQPATHSSLSSEEFILGKNSESGRHRGRSFANWPTSIKLKQLILRKDIFFLQKLVRKTFWPQEKSSLASQNSSRRETYLLSFT